MRRSIVLSAFAAMVFGLASAAPAMAQEDLIFKKSTVWKALTPDDKLAVYGVDDPLVEGVACHYTVPEKGGVKGMFGVAEEVSEVSLACRQIGPIRFKDKAEQGDVVFRERRSLIWKKMQIVRGCDAKRNVLFWKKMQIVRGCDAKRNVLVYLVYSDKLIDGSPQNSTSTVPIMPWGSAGEAPKCSDWIR